MAAFQPPTPTCPGASPVLTPSAFLRAPRTLRTLSVPTTRFLTTTTVTLSIPPSRRNKSTQLISPSTPSPPSLPKQPSPSTKPPIPPQRTHPPVPHHRPFTLVSEHAPAGDQPSAIASLTANLRAGRPFTTLHGVTGSGKTFMMAHVIAEINKPALILAPNKTLAAQLCSEFARFFPHNAVEFFVSHFSHYQPEAYLPASDKYIAKSSVIDSHIDRLRHAATRSIIERSDVIVVASVSSIYGLGLPSDYLLASFPLRVGELNTVHSISDSLKELLYTPSQLQDVFETRGLFHACDKYVHLSPPWEPEGRVYRITLKSSSISAIDAIITASHESPPKAETTSLAPEVFIYPAKHHVTPRDRLETAIHAIERERDECVARFLAKGASLEAKRLDERVSNDIAMMRRVGFCTGMENYTLPLSGRKMSDPPETLLDFMPRKGEWLLFIDESHVTVPQLSAMYAGNAARKRKLVRHGFRLPSAMENRPLSADEFWRKTGQTVFVSATPGAFEIERCGGSSGIAEAVIRPTGVVDPSVEVVPSQGQIEHLTIALAKVVANGGKAIVTTITKRFAEDVADCLMNKPPVRGVLARKLRVSFLHSGIDSVGRMQVLEAMRRVGEDPAHDPLKLGRTDGDDDDDQIAELDVIVGVNLLREGIDLPAVQVVAILDADSEGFLRGETALIQMIGRAARNINGHVIMYADTVTSAMRRAIAETNRRRRLQLAYNEFYNVEAGAVGVSVDSSRSLKDREKYSVLNRIRRLSKLEGENLPQRLLARRGVISRRKVTTHDSRNDAAVRDLGDAAEVQKRMLEAADRHDFEMAALLRDRLSILTGGRL